MTTYINSDFINLIISFIIVIPNSKLKTYIKHRKTKKQSPKIIGRKLDKPVLKKIMTTHE